MKMMRAALVCGALAIGAGTLAVVPQQAQAQTAQFPDVPANHWAYQAVLDLANEGYVIGYPDGKFLGGRTLSRYEFATVIDRIVQTVNDIKAKEAQGVTNPVTPTGVPVTQDDLNKIQVLVDTFQTQLTTIQSDISGLNDSLDALRQDVLDTKAIALKAYTTGKNAQTTADNSYGNDKSRKYSITGYIQARYVEVGSGAKAAYPQGENGNSGSDGPGIAAAVNGIYAQGGSNSSEEVRRARIVVAGSPTNNTSYRL